MFLHVYLYPIRSNGLSSLAHQDLSISPTEEPFQQTNFVTTTPPDGMFKEGKPSLTFFSIYVQIGLPMFKNKKCM